MDPVTQGVLGAIVPQAFASPERMRAVLVAGALGGMAPDLDVLISSADDPLFNIEFHRHFTHSLAFIPVGGLIVAAVLWPAMRRWLSTKQLVLATTLGYATHGLLDACTSYGTQLLWPFSNMRVAWNNVSIVDPLYTVPLLVLAGLAAWKRRATFARVACGFAVAYLLFGVAQRERAEAVVAQVAKARGHTPARLTVKPSFGQILVFRSLYLAEGQWHVDAVRVGWDRRVYPGGSIAPAVLPAAPPGSALAEDLSRFAWFSDDALAMHPDHPDVVGDLRFSALPDGLAPLWGLRLGAVPPEQHAPFDSFRVIPKGSFSRFYAMIRGEALPGSFAP